MNNVRIHSCFNIFKALVIVHTLYLILGKLLRVVAALFLCTCLFSSVTYFESNVCAHIYNTGYCQVKKISLKFKSAMRGFLN